MKKAVIFDLDDTLFPEKEFVKGGFKAVAFELEKWLKEPYDKILSSLFLFRSIDSKKVFDNILKKYNIYSEENLNMLIKIYREHKPSLYLFKDAEITINILKVLGVKLGIISDGYYNVQKNKIEALGLHLLFDQIILTDQLGREYWKPHSKAYVIIMNNLKVQPSECIYVGDNVKKDFIAPKKLGIFTIYIKRQEGIYCNENPGLGGEPDLEISSLTEIIEHL